MVEFLNPPNFLLRLDKNTEISDFLVSFKMTEQSTSLISTKN